jgi:hypothetical protein
MNYFSYPNPKKKNKFNEETKTVESNENSSAYTALYAEQRNINYWPSCWISEQMNDFRQNEKLGCILYQNIGSLGDEKKMGIKIPEAWANYEI